VEVLALRRDRRRVTCWIADSGEGPELAVAVLTGCGRLELVDLASLLAGFATGVPSHSYRPELITCPEATVRGHVETRHTEIAEPEPEPCPTCADGECAIHPSTFRAARRCEQVLEGPDGWRMRCDRVGGHEGPCRPGIL
jgi:hypothetical protein